MLNNIIKRNTMLFSMREFLNQNGFLDIDTPVLAKATPEGARDFIVPSRIQKGSFYALPQSPQLFKQTLMIAGLDKYYQLAKCFRDEDLRADRQPEFTQLDIEMSFVEQEDIINMAEKLAKKVFHDVTGKTIDYTFPRIEYNDAMEFYGSDKPDTRFEMKLIDIKDCVQNKGFSIFDNAEYIKAIVVNKLLSRKNVKDYEDFVKTYYHAKGLAFVKKENNELSSPILKFFEKETIDKLESVLHLENNETALIISDTKEIVLSSLGALRLKIADELNLIDKLESVLHLENNETALIISDTKEIVLSSLGALRLKIADELNLIDKDKFNFLWVVDFPMFEYSEEEQRYKACHHPFTMLKKEDIPLLEKNDLKYIKSDTYDIVLNGYEIGGGGIRIHDSNLQSLVFDRLLIDKEQQVDKFGFLLEALKYGVPPHGGLAFGIDRWLMVMLNQNSIKEVIPFPKTNKGQDLLTDAPSDVDEKQLEKDLQLKKL